MAMQSTCYWLASNCFKDSAAGQVTQVAALVIRKLVCLIVNHL